MRQALAINKARRAVARSQAIPAPVGGWDAVNSWADMPPDRAIVLDNWFPKASGVDMRKGYVTQCTGLGSSVVDTLMPYNGHTSAASKLFGVANHTVYDVTVAGAASATTVTGLNSNRFQYVNFTTTGGQYLWVCNGSDAPRHFDGSAWATPSLSITTFSSTDIVNVNAHKNRLWVVFKDSTIAGYLPTGSIAGTISNFELGGLFTKGGFLQAISTLTRDGGAGDDDYLNFISDRGQVAVYKGTDPSSATTWALVGVYDVGPPIGYKCFTQVGGDVALINIDGVLPLTQSLSTDRGAVQQIAITKNINNAMNTAAAAYKGNFGWQLTPYAKGVMVLLNVPVAEGSTQHQYVMNSLTGAWCRFTGMNANCWAVFRDRLFFGGNDGKVYEADSGGMDGSGQITAIGQGAYNYYKPKENLKHWTMMQPILTTGANVRPSVGVSTDFKDNAVVGTPTAATAIGAVYDSGIYDTDVYAVEGSTTADWTTISGIGRCAAIHFRAQTQSVAAVQMQLNGFHVIYEPGGFM